MTIVETRPITRGVDTHLDTHVAGALDANGGVLGVESFPTTPAGYQDLHAWLAGFGQLARIGIEGTGAYGVGLSRFLQSAGVEVLEVDRPNRQARRRDGKSDPLVAVEAARARSGWSALPLGLTRDVEQALAEDPRARVELHQLWRNRRSAQLGGRPEAAHKRAVRASPMCRTMSVAPPSTTGDEGCQPMAKRPTGHKVGSVVMWASPKQVSGPRALATRGRSR